MRTVLYLLLFSSHLVYSQISKEGEEFLVNLTWDVPLKSSKLLSYNKLNNEKRDILYNISPSSNGWPLTAEFKSNPHLKLNDIQENSEIALSLSLFFDKNNKIKERRLIIMYEKDSKNFHRIWSLIQTFSSKTNTIEHKNILTYEFYAASNAKEPFAIASKQGETVTICIYDANIIIQ